MSFVKLFIIINILTIYSRILIQFKCSFGALVHIYLSSVVCKLFVVSMSSAEELRFRRDLYFDANNSDTYNA